jgi:hypothetical protein
MIQTTNGKCECFQNHVANTCMWMRTTDIENPILLMPYFLNQNNEMIRYNNCPVCGVETRNLEAKRI